MRQCILQEAISESQIEDQRVRLVNIKLYLADNTFEITEPRQANSGLPQGCFLKRTSLRNQSTGNSYTSDDLRIGQEITIHSKTFYVYGAMVSLGIGTKQWQPATRQLGRACGSEQGPVQSKGMGRKSNVSCENIHGSSPRKTHP